MDFLKCFASLARIFHSRPSKDTAQEVKSQEVSPTTISSQTPPLEDRNPEMDPLRLITKDYHQDNSPLIRHGALPSRSSVHSSRSSSQRDRHENTERARTNFHRGEDISEEQLRVELTRMLIKVHKGHWKEFIPRSDIESITTLPVIVQAVQKRVRQKSHGGDRAHETAKEVQKYARLLFTILLWLDKSEYILAAIESGIKDKDLPLELNKNGLLCTQGGKIIPAFTNFKPFTLRDFDRFQWSVNAPFFEMHEKDGPCLEFPEETVLPFIPMKEEAMQKRTTPHMKIGGYSEVTAFDIHPAHHNFWKTKSLTDKQPLIAVKTLLSDDRTEFLKEKTILEFVGTKNHPHLIKLLATYRMDGRYNLVFPCAGSNLRMYWEDRPFPLFDEKTAEWTLKQMRGMAWALSSIHTFKVSFDLDIEGPGGVRMVEGGKLSVKRGEEKYGRHGDIKPENILWFEHLLIGEYEVDEKGILQITDFGLGRFHGRDSRSNIDPRKVQSPPTYEPPECQLGRLVSRAYDLWSLGCVYLEFITWILQGTEQIHAFADARGWTAENSIINDDSFFTISTDNNNEKNAEVREDVRKWVDRLHSDPKCSQAIHDLLDIIMTGLLRIEASDRIPACDLNKKMKDILHRVEKDKIYLLKPVPHPALQKHVKQKTVRIAETWPLENSTTSTTGTRRFR